MEEKTRKKRSKPNKMTIYPEIGWNLKKKHEKKNKYILF